MSATTMAVEPQKPATRSLKCEWCDEVVLAAERDYAFVQPMHRECGFRTSVGSVAHLLRRCNCYKLGSTLSDPPDLTKREAARAAYELFRQMTNWYGHGIEL